MSTVKSDAGGKPNWLFAKRPVDAKSALVLQALGFSQSSTPSLAAYSEIVAKGEALPLRAPAVSWLEDVFPLKAVTLTMLGLVLARLAFVLCILLMCVFVTFSC